MPPTVLRIDHARESITPKEVKKLPTIGSPNMSIPGMGGVVANNPMGDVSGMYNPSFDASSAANGDMPF